MKHLYVQGTDAAAPTFVLLHGTGGNEHDLLPLAQLLNPEASVLALRGSVLENGMPRFFKRLAEGVFDLEDLALRTKELDDFLGEASVTYGFDRGNLVAVGYSNGANMAGSLLFHKAGAFRGAVLHHPMVPRRGVELPDLSGTLIFIGAGTNDPICAPAETEELQQLLTGAGAEVAVHWENRGHQLTRSEVDAAAEWYRKHFAADKEA